jgi:flagellar hook-associated protein 2
MATITTTGPIFQASGLASGLDTASIIDKLVQIESQPITRLQSQQTALKSQISILGDLAAKLSALDTATAALKTGGALGVVSGSNSAFSAAPGSAASPGRYSVQVQHLATAAKLRSQAYGADNTVIGGTLTLSVMGQDYTGIEIAAGSTLAQAAATINAVGAPVSATVLTDSSGQSYLSLTNLATGVPTSGSALSLTYTDQVPYLPGEQALSFSTITAASNSQIQVDGLSFSRQSNSPSDIIPGVTLNLKTEGGAAEDLVLSTDASATQEKLQTFVDAYNAVMIVVQKQLNVSKETDTSKLLTGDSIVQGLGSSLQSVLSAQIGSGTVRSLADLGVESNRDGSLSIDSDTLQQALSRSPQAVNTVFADATGGIAALVHQLVQVQTDSTTGLLTIDSQGLTQRSSDIDTQVEQMQAHVDAYRTQLQARFTAMEQIISGLKTTSQFLTQQFSSSSSSTNSSSSS